MIKQNIDYSGILQLYTADDDLRLPLKKPHTEGGYTYATDGHAIIAIRGMGDYEPHKLGVPKLIEARNCDKTFTLKDLRKGIEKLPKIPEVETKGCKCPECNGEGNVEWEYTDEKGETHYGYFDCPICDGSGGTEREEETGNMVVDDETVVGVFGSSFRADFILLLEQTMDYFKVEKARLVHAAEGKIHLIQITDGIIVGIMPMLTDPKVKIKL